MVANNFQLKGIATLLRTLWPACAPNGRTCGWWLWAENIWALAADWRRGWAWPPPSTFVGPVEDTLPYYAAADIYVHPTIYDTCSLVVLEAAACGLPVVTTAATAPPSCSSDGRDIFLGRPIRRDDEALAAKVAVAVGPGGTRERWADAARQTAVQQTFEQQRRQHPRTVRGGVEQAGPACAGGPLVWTRPRQWRRRSIAAALAARWRTLAACRKTQEALP